VNYDLAFDIIKQNLLGSKIYKGTDYLILNKEDKYSIIRIGKTPRRGLFWEVTGVELISGVEDTVYYLDPEVDVLNKNSMGLLLGKFPDKAVVVQGKFEHVSFITPETVLELTVLEVIPPEPPKLITLTKDVLKFKSFSKPIIIKEKIVNIYDMFNDLEDQTVLLPCHASGSNINDQIQYLDNFPDLKFEDKEKITLAGCELSLRIFKDIYKFEPNFINTCPAKLAGNMIKDDYVLIKCCTAKKPERRGDLFVVPWGATYEDIENIINIFIEQSQ
jgi:hypothetical protein